MKGWLAAVPIVRELVTWAHEAWKRRKAKQDALDAWKAEQNGRHVERRDLSKDRRPR